jgi:hypothetical protein
MSTSKCKVGPRKRFLYAVLLGEPKKNSLLIFGSVCAQAASDDSPGLEILKRSIMTNVNYYVKIQVG